MPSGDNHIIRNKSLTKWPLAVAVPDDLLSQNSSTSAPPRKANTFCAKTSSSLISPSLSAGRKSVSGICARRIGTPRQRSLPWSRYRGAKAPIIALEVSSPATINSPMFAETWISATNCAAFCARSAGLMARRTRTCPELRPDAAPVARRCSLMARRIPIWVRKACISFRPPTARMRRAVRCLWMAMMSAAQRGSLRLRTNDLDVTIKSERPGLAPIGASPLLRGNSIGKTGHAMRPLGRGSTAGCVSEPQPARRTPESRTTGIHVSRCSA